MIDLTIKLTDAEYRKLKKAKNKYNKSMSWSKFIAVKGSSGVSCYRRLRRER